jgi:hypothetical protein
MVSPEARFVRERLRRIAAVLLLFGVGLGVVGLLWDRGEPLSQILLGGGLVSIGIGILAVLYAPGPNVRIRFFNGSAAQVTVQVEGWSGGAQIYMWPAAPQNVAPNGGYWALPVMVANTCDQFRVSVNGAYINAGTHFPAGGGREVGEIFTARRPTNTHVVVWTSGPSTATLPDRADLWVE